MFDACFMEHEARLAESQRDPLLCRLLLSLQEDCRWHEGLADDLVRLLISDSDENRARISAWVRNAGPSVREAFAALATVWSALPEPDPSVLDAVETRTAERLRRLGLDLGEAT